MLFYRCQPQLVVEVWLSEASEGDAAAKWLHSSGLQPDSIKTQRPDPNLGSRMWHAMSSAQQDAACGGDALASPSNQCSNGVDARASGLLLNNHSSELAPLSDSHHPSPARTAELPGVMIIGTDIPDITAGVLSTAAAALQQYDVVIGPAVDGGYYLLGLNHVSQKPFEEVDWSTERVLGQTVQRCQQSGLSIAPLSTLPKLQDIDTSADLERWFEEVGSLEVSKSVSAHDQTAQSAVNMTEECTPIALSSHNSCRADNGPTSGSATSGRSGPCRRRLQLLTIVQQSVSCPKA